MRVCVALASARRSSSRSPRRQQRNSCASHSMSTGTRKRVAVATRRKPVARSLSERLAYAAAAPSEQAAAVRQLGELTAACVLSSLCPSRPRQRRQSRVNTAARAGLPACTELGRPDACYGSAKATKKERARTQPTSSNRRSQFCWRRTQSTVARRRPTNRTKGKETNFDLYRRRCQDPFVAAMSSMMSTLTAARPSLRAGRATVRACRRARAAFYRAVFFRSRFWLRAVCCRWHKRVPGCCSRSVYARRAEPLLLCHCSAPPRSALRG